MLPSVVPNMLMTGPLLARFNIHIEVPRVEYEKLSDRRLGELSSTIQQRVEAARQNQRECFSTNGGENAVACNIDTLEVLRGYLPNRVLGLVLEWAAIHRNELRTNWLSARTKEPLSPIAPLE